MMLPFRYSDDPPPYEPYRKRQFKKTEEKIKMFLDGINSTSLIAKDKVKLINIVKDIVANY